MNKEHLLPIEKSRLGVIGGSGFYSMDQIEFLREIEINTPYGKPSDSIKVYNLGNLEIAFIPRHGRKHSLNPSEIPYKANIWALRSIGVRWIIAPSAVGSLQEQIRPLDIVVPDQFIDRTKNRPATFFNEGAVAHVTMGDPFCTNLCRILNEIGEKNIPGGRQLHRGGTYLAMEGPAFSTRAESTCLWLINNKQTCPRSCRTSATAMPGARWPPVPPHAIIILLIVHAASAAPAVPRNGSRLE